MTDERVFPKSGGDILYPSEVNMFNPKFLGQVEQFTSVNASGTTLFTEIAAITYPGAGSLGVSKYLRAQGTAVKFTGDASQCQWRLRMSGPGVDIVTTTKSETTAIYHVFPMDHIYTSGAITASGGNIGSSYIFSMEAKTSSNGNNARGSDFVLTGW